MEKEEKLGKTGLGLGATADKALAHETAGELTAVDKGVGSEWLTTHLTSGLTEKEEGMSKLEVGGIVTLSGEKEEYKIVEVKGDRIDVELIGSTLTIVAIETVGVEYIDTYTKGGK